MLSLPKTGAAKKTGGCLYLIHSAVVLDFMMNTVFLYALFEPRCEKTGFGVSDQVPHKLGCTTTEDSYRLEISDLESRGIVLSVKRKQRR